MREVATHARALRHRVEGRGAGIRAAGEVVDILEDPVGDGHDLIIRMVNAAKLLPRQFPQPIRLAIAAGEKKRQRGAADVRDGQVVKRLMADHFMPRLRGHRVRDVELSGVAGVQPDVAVLTCGLERQLVPCNARSDLEGLVGKRLVRRRQRVKVQQHRAALLDLVVELGVDLEWHDPPVSTREREYATDVERACVKETLRESFPKIMEPTLLPQPPPDAPAPPPGPEARRSRQKMSMILWLGGISIFLIVVAVPLITSGNPRRGRYSDRVEATNNIKQAHLALLDFDSDYGAFPDASTISAVKAKTSTTLALGSSNSNELFRQLIAADTARGEYIFWARSAGTLRKPNDILGADTLKKGECAFTYIAGLSASSDSNAPVAMAPVIPGTWKFDPKPFGGMAVVLRIDGSAKPETIDKNGDVMIDGMNLFDPRQPYWRGKTPDIKWPE